VVNRLLSQDFPGRSELLHQFRESSVSVVSDYGLASHVTQIHFEVPESKKAPVKSWVPVIGVAADEDGVPLDYVLHVKPDGTLDGLEIVKADGTPIRRMADVSNIEVFVQEKAQGS
jgi:hypothetical protein